MRVHQFGITLVAAFFALSTLIVLAVGLALTIPGTRLDAIWRLYPERQGELTPYAAWMGPLFLALSASFVAASIGCFLRRRWGWWLAVTIFVTNAVGDIFQFAIGRVLEGLVGVLVAAAILWWLTRPDVRAVFGTRRRS